MIATLIVVIALLIIVMNVYAWKSGILQTAEKPTAVLDKPIMDKSEKRAVLKRLKRWREEGKLSREEFETFYALCQSEWDES